MRLRQLPLGLADSENRDSGGRFHAIARLPQFARAFAALSTVALGVTVLIGWHAHVVHLVQIHPRLVPMQYNTALCFVALGVGVGFLIAGRERSARLCGLAAAGVGALTLFQYLSGFDLRIDQLLMEHAITVETSHPGRMAPNTALCFILAGATVSLGLRQRHRFVAGVGAGLLVLLGAIPLLGYLVGSENAYGWGRFTRMAAHTAVGFVLFGGGLLAATLGSREPVNSDDPWQVRRGIGFRVTLLVAMSVVVSVGIVAIWNYQRITAILISESLHRLDRQSAEIGRHVQDRVRHLRGDVQLLVRSETIARFAAGSPDSAWKEQLATTFESMLLARPDYLQIRLIEATSEGREILRLEREGDGVRRVPDSALQPKGERDYVRAARELPAGRIELSEITLNREHGRISEPYTPVLRASAAIRDGNDRPLAVVVINQDQRPVFARLRQQIAGSSELYVVRANGDFLSHPESDRCFAAERGHAYDFDDLFPDLRDHALWSRAASASGIFAGADGYRRAAGVLRLELESDRTDRFVVVAVASPLEEVVAATSGVANQSLILGLLIVALALVLAHFVARSITEPLRRIAASLRRFEAEQKLTGLPTEAGDESGVLARALNQMSELIRERTGQLEQSNIELQRFTYIASHDLQAPLRAIAGFAQFLAKDYDDVLDDRGRDYIDRVVRGCRRMQVMLRDLDCFASVERRARPFRTIDTNLVVDEVIIALDAAIDESGGRVTRDELPPLRGDASQIAQLLQNLVANGVKYRGDEAPRVHVSAGETDDAIHVTVTDNGIGIPAKYHRRVFEIFKRLHTHDRFPGTGIGLAVCRRIVERHGGTIELSSSPGEGSRFTFSIPKGGADDLDHGT